ncbi:hypothetical protein TELCIR_17227, partial [Teladorsagia circumcincta]
RVFMPRAKFANHTAQRKNDLVIFIGLMRTPSYTIQAWIAFASHFHCKIDTVTTTVKQISFLHTKGILHLMQWLLGLSALICYVQCQLNCDILDPECRASYRSGGKRTALRHKVKNSCNYQDVWLIPGRADASCTRPGAKRVLEINPGQIRIKPDVVRLPGCFTLEIKNLREFCFNDWAAFDSDGDCEMDFLQGDKGDYRGALATLQQVGYGSVIAKIRLAFNATGSVERKRLLKEAQIEETVAKELEERRRTWDVNNGQFDKFSQWYIEYRKNIWHK